MTITWPEKFHPSRAPVHVRNGIEIAAPCERVWAWLARAELWPTWYDNAADVQFLNGPGPDLAPGTQFRWRTFGVRIVSTVQEFEPPFRMAWDAITTGVEAWHAWLLEPTAGGCHVTTEETQYGVFARTGDLLMPNRMSRGHQRWLEGLRDQALSGPPPSITVP
jgi:uncharacterized protein YndB with AHSA1/START domain